MRLRIVAFSILVSTLAVRAVRAQEANGQEVFNQACAACHSAPAPGSRAQNLESLREQAPTAVLEALTTGSMRPQAQRLNPSEIRAVAEFRVFERLTPQLFH